MRQQAQIAFTTMLGSGQKARTFLDQLASFAAKTPFEFPELVRSSQRLLAMGFEAKELIPTLTAIGDAVAGLGGSSEQVQRVTTALGQMQAKGRASNEELLQLTEAGIPALQFISQAIGKTTNETFKAISKGQVSADVAIDALVKGMNTKFGGMMALQSRTFGGLFSTVKDTFSQISGAVMAPFFDLATRGLARVADAAPAIQAAVDRFMAAKGIRAKLNIVWEGVEGAAGALMDKIREALVGKTSALGGGKHFILETKGMTFKTEGLVGQVSAALAGLDWSQVGKTIGDGIADAVSISTDAAMRLADVIAGAMRQIDWVALGRAAGPGLAAAIVTAFATLTDPGFWVKNWDLALAVGAVALGGPIGRLGGRIIGLLARPFEAAILAVGGIIARLSPRLADAFLSGMLRIPGLVSSLLSPLVGFVSGIFGRLGAVARFTVRVLGVQAIINVLGQLASKAWEKIKALFGALEDAAGQVGPKASEIGRRIVSGIISGLGGLVGALKAAVEGKMRSALDHITPWSPIEAGAARLLGKPIGVGLIRGFLLASAELPEKITDRLRSALEAGRRQIEAFSGRIGDAFSRLTGYITSAFDEATRQHQTATERLISQTEAAFRNRRLADAVTDARKRLDEAMKGDDPEAVKAADLALREAIFEQQRVVLDRMAAEERKQYEASRNLQREQMERRLADLQAQLLRHPEQWKKIMGQINALLAKSGVDMQTSGQLMGNAFAVGMQQALTAIRKAALAIANLLKRLLKLRSPAEEGPLSDAHTWWGGLADELLKGVRFDSIRARFVRELDPATYATAARRLGLGIGQAVKAGIDAPLVAALPANLQQVVAAATQKAFSVAVPGIGPLALAGGGGAAGGPSAPLVPILGDIRATLGGILAQSEEQTGLARNPTPVEVTATVSGAASVFRDPNEIAARALR